jgi:hypothetical protein
MPAQILSRAAREVEGCRSGRDLVTRRIRAMGIRDKPIAPGSPWQNCFVERLIGTIRRECVDHVIALGEQHLRQVLKSYASLLQQRENAPRIRQGCADLSPGSAVRTYRIACLCQRAASPLPSNLSFRDARRLELSYPSSFGGWSGQEHACGASWRLDQSGQIGHVAQEADPLGVGHEALEGRGRSVGRDRHARPRARDGDCASPGLEIEIVPRQSPAGVGEQNFDQPAGGTLIRGIRPVS